MVMNQVKEVGKEPYICYAASPAAGRVNLTVHFCADTTYVRKEQSKIGKQLRVLTCDPRATEFLRQRISIAIQIGNATSILGTIPASSSLDEIFYFS